MNERDRLIELLKAHCLLTPKLTDCTAPDETECADCLADHLLANGIIVPPCKVGDVVYGYHPANKTTILPMIAKWIETNEKEDWTVAAQYAPMAPRYYLFSDFGKTVFLTREEAEQALKERGQL